MLEENVELRENEQMRLAWKRVGEGEWVWEWVWVQLSLTREPGWNA